MVRNSTAAVPVVPGGGRIEFRSVNLLRPCPHNARTHTKHQIRQIAESIRVFGFTNPVLTDGKDQILAGHGRVEAAKLLGIDSVPTLRLDTLTQDQVRAYVLADNKLAQNAGWDTSILAIELQHLLTLDVADFDVTITGFEVAEIDLILGEAAAQPGPEELIPEPGPTAVSELGDLWLLGKHKILCGSSLEEETYKALMREKRASLVFTDPPYNVAIDGHVTGNGAIHHREFKMASGEMSEPEFLSFLVNSSTRNDRHAKASDYAYAGEAKDGTDRRFLETALALEPSGEAWLAR